MKLTPHQKFELARVNCERVFKAKFTLIPTSKDEKEVRMAVFRICRRNDVTPKQMVKICRDIDRYTTFSQKSLNEFVRNAYHYELDPANSYYRKKYYECLDEVSDIIKEHNQVEVKTIAAKSWRLTPKTTLSGKAKLVMADMILQDRGMCLFSLGLKNIE